MCLLLHLVHRPAPRALRREVVAAMSAKVMSTLAIGSAIGVGDSTVQRDLTSGAQVGARARTQLTADQIARRDHTRSQGLCGSTNTIDGTPCKNKREIGKDRCHLHPRSRDRDQAVAPSARVVEYRGNARALAL